MSSAKIAINVSEWNILTADGAVWKTNAGTGIGQDNILMQCSHNGQINYTTVRRNLKEDGTPEKLLWIFLMPDLHLN